MIDDDGFGANDDDWAVYREIVSVQRLLQSTSYNANSFHPSQHLFIPYLTDPNLLHYH